MGIRAPGGLGGGVGNDSHNKIRVVIRMRPFLEGEKEQLAHQSNI